MKTGIKNPLIHSVLIAGLGLILSDRVTAQTFTTLHSFSAVYPPGPYSLGTNSDGANPAAGLILTGNMLYGTANVGGALGSGNVFKLNTDGTGFTNLHSFTATFPSSRRSTTG